MIKRRAIPLIWVISIAFISVGIFISTLAIAGSLEPPASPASTMKTLDQVEPRIPIPGSSTAVSEYLINESGSYYLSGDRLCSGNGIMVNADNVTIDLMGYSLIGTNPDNAGVSMVVKKNVEIRNGTIREFGCGIYESSVGEGNRVINVRVVLNHKIGIYLQGEGHLVKGCTVWKNGDTYGSTVYGILVGPASIVSGNTVKNNGMNGGSSVVGIRAFDYSQVTDNMIMHNGDSAGGTVYGIHTGGSCLIANNTVNKNGYNCSNNVCGINTASSNRITGNTVTNNGKTEDSYGYGINFSIYSFVDKNLAYGNIPADIRSNCTLCRVVDNYPSTD